MIQILCYYFFIDHSGSSVLSGLSLLPLFWLYKLFVLLSKLALVIFRCEGGVIDPRLNISGFCNWLRVNGPVFVSCLGPPPWSLSCFTSTSGNDPPVSVFTSCTACDESVLCIPGSETVITLSTVLWTVLVTGMLWWLVVRTAGFCGLPGALVLLLTVFSVWLTDCWPEVDDWLAVCSPPSGACLSWNSN